MYPQFQFQPPFDSMVYQLAKSEGKGLKEKGPSDRDIKPIYHNHDTSKSTTGTSETLLPMAVYDLTADESLVQLPKPTYQQAAQATAGQATQEQATPGQPIQGQPTQATQELASREPAQATREIKDGNNQDREVVTREASAEHINEDLPQQGYSPKEHGMLGSGAGEVQHSSRDIRQRSIDEGALGHCAIPSAQSSNGASGLSTDAASNALPTCWESRGTPSAGVPSCTNTSLQDGPELQPDDPSHLCRQAADNNGSAHPDGVVSPDLAMDDADDTSILPDDWEGKIIREYVDGYLVAWKSSFIPKEYAGEAMIRAWEGKKANIPAGGGKTRRGTGSKQPATIKGRVEKSGAGKRDRRPVSQ
ncbi:hypothetical protein F5883DRAFT_722187 [Diaporthe sp. PMI_573]|nr:hypothetical protein F5883DRAFT_722187 [Diaporthaceae sp. PMI_573]